MYDVATFTYDARPPQFTGKERDSESGLDYSGARYYAPTMGRFTRPDDPFADQEADDPQSWNLYTYGRNNPLRYTDPTGNACVSNDGGKTYQDDDSGGESCAEVDENNENAEPSVTVTATYTDDERIQMLADDISNLTSVSSLSEVGRNGMEGAMTAEAVWNLPSVFRNGWSAFRAWQAGRAAETLAQAALSGSKQVVKANLKSLGPSVAQEAKVSSALRRATNEAVVSVEKLADGSVRVSTSTPGVNTGQSIVKVIDKAGNTLRVDQVHLDSAGRTVVDRKF